METEPVIDKLDLSQQDYHDLDTLRWNAFLDFDQSALLDLEHEAKLRWSRTIRGSEDYQRYFSLMRGCRKDYERLEAILNGRS